jgi:hypothetical protein
VHQVIKTSRDVFDPTKANASIAADVAIKLLSSRVKHESHTRPPAFETFLPQALFDPMSPVVRCWGWGTARGAMRRRRVIVL